MQVLLVASVIGTILGAIGFWGRVSIIVRMPINLFLTVKRIDHSTANVLIPYLAKKYKRLTRNDLFYFSVFNYVKPLKHIRRIFIENLTISHQIFFDRWRPIWYSVSRNTDGQDMKITYLRGALDWDSLLEEVAENEYQENESTDNNRFYINYHTGNNFEDSEARGGSKLSQWQKMSVSSEAPRVGRTVEHSLRKASDGIRFIHWQPEQLGKDSITLSSMSIRPELQTVIDEVRFFIGSRAWFEDRGIPWRRGWLLHGLPGTGKTSLVRGIAVEFNLPIHILDLASMFNWNLRSAWTEIASSAPCIVLIEDIDSVFRGRDNITKQGGVSFDSLLNCISGISPSEGILTFVTSNKLDDIDPALLRGGRLDRSVLVQGLDYQGKVKLAERILENRDEAIAIADNSSYENVTPAELQEILSRIAITRRFG